MSKCEFCGHEVENPSHTVVNGRIFLNDEDTCEECGYDDEELLDWVQEYQPGDEKLVREELNLE